MNTKHWCLQVYKGVAGIYIKMTSFVLHLNHQDLGFGFDTLLPQRTAIKLGDRLIKWTHRQTTKQNIYTMHEAEFMTSEMI